MDTAPATGTLRALVAEEVRALLARKRISATALAKLIGVSQTYVWRRLSGETAFDLDDLEKIAKVLECRVVDLLPRQPKGGGEVTARKRPMADRPTDNRPNGRGRSDEFRRPSTEVRRPQKVLSPLPGAAMTLVGGA